MIFWFMAFIVDVFVNVLINIGMDLYYEVGLDVMVRLVSCFRELLEMNCQSTRCLIAIKFIVIIA